MDFDTVEAACTWADASTVATVSEVLRPTVKSEDVNLETFASEVDAIRNDVRAS